MNKLYKCFSHGDLISFILAVKVGIQKNISEDKTDLFINDLFIELYIKVI